MSPPMPARTVNDYSFERFRSGVFDVNDLEPRQRHVRASRAQTYISHKVSHSTTCL